MSAMAKWKRWQMMMLTDLIFDERRRRMKRMALMVILALAVFTGCTRVEPGYAGIKVHNYGSQRGVEDFPVLVGRVWFNPLTTDVYKFPTFVQHYNWDVYGDNDDSFVVNSTEGSVIEFDVATALVFEEPMVPSLFVEFRRSPDEIVNGYVRSLFEREFTRIASRMRATEIVGNGKAELIQNVQDAVAADIGPKGIAIQFVTITGEMRLDEQVSMSINAVLTAAQQALEAENRIAQAQHEASQAIARARGDSLALVIAASGQAEANRILSQALTSNLIQYESLRKWNGVLPTVTGGSVPFVNIP